jgi:hypothetical protein
MSITDYNSDTLKELNSSLAGSVDCGCGCTDGHVGLERTRFFARQLVGPDDLTQDQVYFRERARRHNRLMHGWGIACGARVRAGTKPCEVLVDPGLVLGPYGDEIVIDQQVTFDVCKQDPAGAAFDPCGGGDPWCADVRIDPKSGETLYLAVRYAECDSRPVRVSTCGCGCDDSECEYSRTRDSFELKVLTELPEDYKRRDKITPLAQVMLLMNSFLCLGGPRRCPPCPTSPWVILADFTVDTAGTVDVQCAPHRHYVASFGDYFFKCNANVSGLSFPLMAQKQSALIETSGPDFSVDAPPAAAMVAAKTGDGRWLTVPGNFTVEKGDTIRTLLDREGGRTLIDAGSGEALTLRELYSAAGASPDTKVETVAEALAPLEGATIDVSGLRVVRGAYEELIDAHGLDELDSAHGGAPGAAPQLAAKALRGVESESAVGKHVADKTVADIAAVAQDQFVADATKGLRGAQLTAETNRARDTWTAATRVAKLSRAWET